MLQLLDNISRYRYLRSTGNFKRRSSQLCGKLIIQLLNFFNNIYISIINPQLNQNRVLKKFSKEKFRKKKVLIKKKKF